MTVGKFYIFVDADGDPVVWSTKEFDRTLDAAKFVKENGDTGNTYYVYRYTAGPLEVHITETRKLVDYGS